MKKNMTKNRRNQNQTAVIRQVMPRERIPGTDVLLTSLDEPLPTATVNKIIELHKQKEPRSKIAKKLGISKLQVNHELMKRGG